MVTMVVAELKIVPLGTGSTSLSKYVAEVQRYLDENAPGRSVGYQLTPMSTILEGSRGDIAYLAFGAVDHIFDTFPDEVHRISVDLHIDDRRDREATMRQKLESVERRLRE